jgi:hypothetical protein
MAVPGQADGVIVFEIGHGLLAGDARSLEFVLSELLGRRARATEEIGSATGSSSGPLARWSSDSS